jgi:superfamily II helicase
MIYIETEINSINTLTIEIEKDFNESYSVLAYDSEGFIWIEKFADTIKGAEKIADNLYKKLIKL